jgi:predicted alpha/beta superfamily hydrolase
MVGISYNTNPFDYAKLRERDYIPPNSTSDNEHRGDNFLNFIKTELIPYMETTYGTDPDDRGLLGFSYGGLFTTWVLKQEPKLFNKLAILSPSLQYGDGFLIKDSELINNISNLNDLDVFLSFGSLEGSDFINYGNDLHELLKKNKKIHVKKVIFQDESHGSVWNAATTRAILTLYGNKYKALLQEAYAFYEAKEFVKSLESYELAIISYPAEADNDDKYDLACLYALTVDPDNAFKYL